MLKIEYEIKLNENGRPYIDLPTDYEDKPEDKFFVLELARYLLQNVYVRRSAEFDPYTAAKLDDCINILGQVSDEVAILLFKQMQVIGDFAIITNRNYDVQVDSIEERNKLNYNGFIYNNKIYVRHEGLKVLVLSDMKIYELQGGIDDTNWELNSNN
jgi:hypothetical protein